MPELYAVFNQLATKYMSKVQSCTLPGSQWLQVYLSNILKDTLGIAVKHRCYGTLLFRKNGDLLNALSKALGELKSAHKTVYVGSSVRVFTRVNSHPKIQ